MVLQFVLFVKAAVSSSKCQNVKSVNRLYVYHVHHAYISKRQRGLSLSQMNAHDGIVLQTDVDDQCDKPSVDLRRYCQLVTCAMLCKRGTSWVVALCLCLSVSVTSRCSVDILMDRSSSFSRMNSFDLSYVVL